jgi:uncharacterized protein
LTDWHDPKELERLDKALMALPEENGAMLLPEFDGFCTGLLVCPDMIPPSEWLNQVWGPDGPPEFDSMDHMQAVLDLIMGHYNRVAGMLTPPAYFGPVIDEVTSSGEVMWEFWVEGFMTAVALRPEAWKKVTRDGDDHTLAAMMGMMSLSRFARERSQYSQAEQRERDDDAVDLIMDSVLELNRFAKGLPPEALFEGMPWDTPNPANAPFAPHRSTKIGRNEPCPCGSGKKYKKCCGAN